MTVSKAATDAVKPPRNSGKEIAGGAAVKPRLQQLTSEVNTVYAS